MHCLLALLLPLLVNTHTTNCALPLDCQDIYKDVSKHSGVYTIYPTTADKPVKVYCDMGCGNKTGQWTVIQRRIDGSVSFYRPWADYKEGFGTKYGEYWLANCLAYVNGWKFSTYDKDQDGTSRNCAETYGGGFWFVNCHYGNPNGLYKGKGKVDAWTGILWYPWRNQYYSMKSIVMKIKRI